MIITCEKCGKQSNIDLRKPRYQEVSSMRPFCSECRHDIVSRYPKLTSAIGHQREYWFFTGSDYDFLTDEPEPDRLKELHNKLDILLDRLEQPITSVKQPEKRIEVWIDKNEVVHWNCHSLRSSDLCYIGQCLIQQGMEQAGPIVNTDCECEYGE